MDPSLANAVLWFLAVTMVLNAASAVLLIGHHRTPTTPVTALFVVVVDAIFLAAILTKLT